MELSKHVTRMTRTRGEDGTCYKVDWFAPVQVQLELQESISRAHACLLKDQLDIYGFGTFGVTRACQFK